MGDGEQVREYVHVEDATRALIGLMKLPKGELVTTMKSWPGDVQAWYADVTNFSPLGYRPEIRWIERVERDRRTVGRDAGMTSRAGDESGTWRTG